MEIKDATYGFCADCGVIHSLGVGNAQNYCRELMRELEKKRRIDYLVADDEADPHFSTDYLFGEARGQMFGVLARRNFRSRTRSICTCSSKTECVCKDVDSSLSA